MWICFNDGFVSAVQHRDSDWLLIVRSRREDILRTLFPESEVIVGDSTDYKYRVVVSKSRFAEAVCKRIAGISYPNFKDSVADGELNTIYQGFWLLHRAYQR